MRRVAIALVLAANVPAAANPAPTVTLACVKTANDLELRTDGPRPIACTAAGCVVLDHPIAAIARPAERSVWSLATSEVRSEHGKRSVCSGTTCTPIGERLKATIEATYLAAGPRPILIAGTTDRKAVLVEDALWSVGDDRPIAPKPKSRPHEDPGGLFSYALAGNYLIATWANCAGPCRRAVVIDSTAKVHGPVLDGGGPILQIDSANLAVISEWGTVQVIDARTAALKATLALGTQAGPPDVAAVRLDDGFAVLVTSGTYLKVVTLRMTGNDLNVVQEAFVPICP